MVEFLVSLGVYSGLNYVAHCIEYAGLHYWRNNPPNDTMWSIKTIQEWYILMMKNNTIIPSNILDKQILSSTFLYDLKTRQIMRIFPKTSHHKSHLTLRGIISLHGDINNSYICLNSEQNKYIFTSLNTINTTDTISTTDTLDTINTTNMTDTTKLSRGISFAC
jgi:hypothetical protein